jgi:hypothetical protein
VAPGERARGIALLAEDYERWGDAHERIAGRSRHTPQLAEIMEEWRARHRRWVRRLFGRELDSLQRAPRSRATALLVVVLDIGTYRRLRVEGLSPRAAAHSMHRLAQAALAAGTREGGGEP